MDGGPERSALLRVQGPLFWAIGAVAAYSTLAVYVAGPYWCQWPLCGSLRPLGMIGAAMGTYLLGRRWIQSGPASLLSGALYGFGPGLLWLLRLHPAAACVAVLLPWLFCPAVYVPLWIQAKASAPGKFSAARRWEIPLYAAPFGIVIAAAAILVRYGILAPRGLRAADWVGWVAPSVALGHGYIPAGIYHAPLAALVIGLTMALKARRWPLVAAPVVALAMAGWPQSWLQAPSIWFTLASFWAAVVAGIGIDGLVWAGWPDRRWLAVGLLLVAAAAVGALAWAFYLTKLDPAIPIEKLLYTFRMYGIGIAWLALILSVLWTRERQTGLRQLAAAVAVGLDLVLSSRMIADSLF